MTERFSTLAQAVNHAGHQCHKATKEFAQLRVVLRQFKKEYPILWLRIQLRAEIERGWKVIWHG